MQSQPKLVRSVMIDFWTRTHTHSLTLLSLHKFSYSNRIEVRNKKWCTITECIVHINICSSDKPFEQYDKYLYLEWLSWFYRQFDRNRHRMLRGRLIVSLDFKTKMPLLTFLFSINAIKKHNKFNGIMSIKFHIKIHTHTHNVCSFLSWFCALSSRIWTHITLLCIEFFLWLHWKYFRKIYRDFVARFEWQRSKRKQ